MDGPLPLSIFIIAKNEADRIGETIAAVRDLTDDLVVVDSGSTRRHAGASPESSARGSSTIPGRATARRSASPRSYAGTIWLLNLDADEVVPADLAAEIAALFAAGEPPRDAYRDRASPRSFPGEGAPHPLGLCAGAGPPLPQGPGPLFALASCTTGSTSRRGPGSGRLKGIIHHCSVRSLGDQIDKLNRYSDQQAVDLDLRGVAIPTWRVFFELPAAFLKAYIGRRHALRGTYGFLTAMNYAISRHLRLAKHYERRRHANAARNPAVRPPEIRPDGGAP